MNPWGGQTVTPLTLVYLVLLRFALLLVLTHLSLRWCSAMLGHFYCKYLHVGVYYQDIGICIGPVSTGCLAAVNCNFIYSASSHSKY